MNVLGARIYRMVLYCVRVIKGPQIRWIAFRPDEWMCVCVRAVYVIAVRMYREIFHVSRAIVFIPVDVAHFAKGANRSKHNDNDAEVCCWWVARNSFLEPNLIRNMNHENSSAIEITLHYILFRATYWIMHLLLRLSVHWMDERHCTVNDALCVRRCRQGPLSRNVIMFCAF